MQIVRKHKKAKFIPERDKFGRVSKGERREITDIILILLQKVGARAKNWTQYRPHIAQYQKNREKI